MMLQEKGHNGEFLVRDSETSVSVTRAFLLLLPCRKRDGFNMARMTYKNTINRLLCSSLYI